VPDLGKPPIKIIGDSDLSKFILVSMLLYVD